MTRQKPKTPARRRTNAQSEKLPLHALELWGKQVDRALLNDLSRAALQEACADFMTAEEFARTIPSDVYAPLAKSHGRERRFAGDAVLPRGRYHTVCVDETGADGGTLLSELIAYFDPARPGSVGFEEADLSAPENADSYASFGYAVPSHERALRLWFPPLNGRARPFLEAEGIRTVQTVGVWIPLVVRRLCFERAIDLRDPTVVGGGFVRAVSTMRIPVDQDLTIPAFPNRPPLNSFWELLPSLLHQDRGGDSTCRAIGFWLRSLGVDALVYPSARTDSGVLIENRIVKRWHGWNLVDYRNAPTHGVMVVEESHEWPVNVWESRGFQVAGESPQLPVLAIGIERETQGERKGSWQAFGISARLRERTEGRVSGVVASFHEGAGGR